MVIPDDDPSEPCYEADDLLVANTVLGFNR